MIGCDLKKLAKMLLKQLSKTKSSPCLNVRTVMEDTHLCMVQMHTNIKLKAPFSI